MQTLLNKLVIDESYHQKRTLIPIQIRPVDLQLHRTLCNVTIKECQCQPSLKYLLAKTIPCSLTLDEIDGVKSISLERLSPKHFLHEKLHIREEQTQKGDTLDKVQQKNKCNAGWDRNGDITCLPDEECVLFFTDYKSYVEKNTYHQGGIKNIC